MAPPLGTSTHVRPRWLAPYMLVSSALIAVLWIAALVNGIGPERTKDPVALAAFSALAAGCIALQLRAARCGVELRDADLVVVGLRRVRTLRWVDIAECSADYAGLHLRTHDGEVVTSRVFGRPQWRSLGVRRRSTGEDLAEVIAARADAAPRNGRGVDDGAQM